jgi:hypothetical protein
MIPKEKILETCKQLLLQRISHAELAMKAAQESSNSEDKSSAGDKYETARAMGQLDRNMNAKQLAQAQQELFELQKIDTKPSRIIKSGSFIETSQASYFIAIGLGPVKIDQTTVIILSPKSPLASQMLHKKEGDTFVFGNNNHSIKLIY